MAKNKNKRPTPSKKRAAVSRWTGSLRKRVRGLPWESRGSGQGGGEAAADENHNVATRTPFEDVPADEIEILGNWEMGGM